MKKRSYLLVIVLFLAVLSGDASAQQAEEKLYTIPYIGFDGTIKEEPVFYSDSYFLGSSRQRNPALAHASMALSAAAYSQEYILFALQNMGFEDVTTYNYDEGAQWEENPIAFTLARKLISLGGKRKDLFVIVIRGTPTSSKAEWDSNKAYSPFGELFDFKFDAEEHAGFEIAKGKVQAAFRDYYKQAAGSDYAAPFMDTDMSNNVLWICGHSRGAAVANLICAEFSKLSYAPNEKTFAYCFACPQVIAAGKFNAALDVTAWNYINAGDLVTCVPPLYKRFGKDVVVSKSSKDWQSIAAGFKTRNGDVYQGLDLSPKNLMKTVDSLREISVIEKNVKKELFKYFHSHSLEFYLSWTSLETGNHFKNLPVPMITSSVVYARTDDDHYKLNLTWKPVAGAEEYTIYVTEYSDGSFTNHVLTINTKNTKILLEGNVFSCFAAPLSIQIVASKGNERSFSQPLILYFYEDNDCFASSFSGSYAGEGPLSPRKEWNNSSLIQTNGNDYV